MVMIKKIIRNISIIIIVLLILISLFFYFLPYFYLKNEVPTIPDSWYDVTVEEINDEKEEESTLIYCSEEDEQYRDKYAELMLNYIENKFVEDSFKEYNFSYYEEEGSDFIGICELNLESEYLNSIRSSQLEVGGLFKVYLYIMQDSSFILTDTYLDRKYYSELCKYYTKLASEMFNTEVSVEVFSNLNKDIGNASFEEYLKNLDMINIFMEINKNADLKGDNNIENEFIIEEISKTFVSENYFISASFFPSNALFMSNIEDKSKFYTTYYLSKVMEENNEITISKEWVEPKLDYEKLIGEKIDKGLLYLSNKYSDDTFEIVDIEDAYFPYDGVKEIIIEEETVKYHINYNLWFYSKNLDSIVGYTCLSNASETKDGNLSIGEKLEELFFNVDLSSYSHIQLNDLETDTYVISKYNKEAENYYSNLFSDLIEWEYEVYCKPLIYDSSCIPINIFSILSGKVDKYDRKVEIDNGIDKLVKSKYNPYILTVVINKDISKEEKLDFGLKLIEYIKNKNVNSSHIRFVFSSENYEELKEVYSLNVFEYDTLIFEYNQFINDVFYRDLIYDNFNITRNQNGLGGYRYVILN